MKHQGMTQEQVFQSETSSHTPKIHQVPGKSFDAINLLLAQTELILAVVFQSYFFSWADP